MAQIDPFHVIQVKILGKPVQPIKGTDLSPGSCFTVSMMKYGIESKAAGKDIFI
jgi:hypothetical protein